MEGQRERLMDRMRGGVKERMEGRNEERRERERERERERARLTKNKEILVLKIF